MASSWPNSCLFLVTVSSLLTFSAASFFHVGGADGWSSSKNVNYTQWANSIHFQVDDVLIFEYDNKTENVLRVSSRSFSSCNLSAPLRKWTSGTDTVRLHRPGSFHFISSMDGKCEGKAKVSFEVYDHDHDTPATPSPAASTLAPAPAPKPSSAPVAKDSVLPLCFCLLILIGV